MIAHYTLCTKWNDWILPYHLSVYSRFCDDVVVVLDDWDAGAAIVESFPRCRAVKVSRDGMEPGYHYNANGVYFEDGKLRQIGWDACAERRPDWIILTDVDETPTPNIVDLLANLDPAIDCYYADWVNLWQHHRQALGGVNAKWSFQNPRQSKRPLVARRRDGVTYRYELQRQHLRHEPNPLNPCKTVYDATHVYTPHVKVIHYKYAAWSRWMSDPLRTAGGQYGTLDADATIVPVPLEWHWPGVPEECGNDRSLTLPRPEPEPVQPRPAA